MVYVDNPRIGYGRMLMCHMAADSTDELVDMARLIGVSARWIQKAGTHREHFDICSSMREKAIRHGASCVSTKQIAMLMRAKSKLQPPIETRKENTT